MSAIWTSGQRAMARVLWWGKAGEHPQHGPHMDPHQAAAVWGPRRANPAYGLGSWVARTLEVHSDLKLCSFPQYSPQVFREIAKQETLWF